MRRSLTVLLAIFFLALGIQAKAATLSDWQLDLTSLGGPLIAHISDGVGGINFNGNVDIVQQLTGGNVAPGDAFSISPVSGTSLVLTAASYIDSSSHNMTPLLQTGQGTLTLVFPTLTGAAVTAGPDYSFALNNTDPFILEYTSPTNVTTPIALFNMLPSDDSGGIAIMNPTSTSALLEGFTNVSGAIDMLTPDVLLDASGNPLTAPFYSQADGAIGSGINLLALFTLGSTALTADHTAYNGNFTISAEAAPVPEPATLLLKSGGLLGMFFTRRRAKIS